MISLYFFAAIFSRLFLLASEQFTEKEKLSSTDSEHNLEAIITIIKATVCRYTARVEIIWKFPKEVLSNISGEDTWFVLEKIRENGPRYFLKILRRKCWDWNYVVVSVPNNVFFHWLFRALNQRFLTFIRYLVTVVFSLAHGVFPLGIPVAGPLLSSGATVPAFCNFSVLTLLYLYLLPRATPGIGMPTIPIFSSPRRNGLQPVSSRTRQGFPNWGYVTIRLPYMHTL